MIQLRSEQPGDALSVNKVNELTFGQPTEVILVEQIRSACPEALSMVAVMDEQVVGHILFTPVLLENHKKVFIFDESVMSKVSGVVKYREEFTEAI